MRTPPEIDNRHSLIPLPDRSLAITPPGAKRILSEMIGDSLAVARQELDASECAEEFFEKGNECYYMGRGNLADQAEAVSWYLKAAGLGHTHAQYNLGQCYAEGLGVPVDTVEADKWFKLAAEQGHKDAQKHVTQIAPVVEDESRTVLAGQRQSVEIAKFKIGDYEWCEPDWRQIIIWAKELSLEPVTVIERLFDRRSFKDDNGYKSFPDWAGTRIEHGRILGLHLDLELLPLERFNWVEGLALASLSFAPQVAPRQIGVLSVPFSTLVNLHCERLGLTEIDLSSAYALRRLNCSVNHLAKIDLGSMPKLNELECYMNKGCQFDLSNVPELKKLVCNGNDLKELDLSGVPHLTELSCNLNDICALDLSHVPDLRKLWCCHLPKLRNLDLQCVPKLTELALDYMDQFPDIDLSCVPRLTRLSRHTSQLRKLDLSHLSELIFLDCSFNELIHLDLTPVPKLKELSCYGNDLAELDIRCVEHLEKLFYNREQFRLIHRTDQKF